MADEIQKWEYRVVNLGGVFNGPKPEDMQELLNQWGQEGWELMTAVQNEGTKMMLVAKRPTQRSPRRQSGWPSS